MYQQAAQRLKQCTRSAGHAHNDKGLPGTLFELQEATPSSQVAQTRPELRIGTDAKDPQELSPFSSTSDTIPSNSS